MRERIQESRQGTGGERRQQQAGAQGAAPEVLAQLGVLARLAVFATLAVLATLAGLC